MSEASPNHIARLSALTVVGMLCALASSIALTTSPPAAGAVQLPWKANRRVVKSVAGDFNGDGFADYVDHDRSTGILYVHANLGVTGAIEPCADGSMTPALRGFAPNGTNWKVGYSAYETIAMPNGSIMIGDFNGDHFADFAEHDDVTGQFSVLLNDEQPGGAFNRVRTSSSPTCVGAMCEVLVADFTGDGCTDYADHDLSTGMIYVHENLFREMGSITFAPYGQNWATAQVCAPGQRCLDIYPSDVNGDGYADLELSDGDYGMHFFEYKPSTGTYERIGHFPWSLCAGCEIFTGDFDGDGKSEYATHDAITGAMTLSQHTQDARCTLFTWSTCGGTGCDLLGLPGGKLGN